jgi:hypothetical protein
VFELQFFLCEDDAFINMGKCEWLSASYDQVVCTAANNLQDMIDIIQRVFPFRRIQTGAKIFTIFTIQVTVSRDEVYHQKRVQQVIVARQFDQVFPIILV